MVTVDEQGRGPGASSAVPPTDVAADPTDDRRTGRGWDLAAVLGSVAGAAYLLIRILRDVPGRALGTNAQDEAFFTWMLAHGARVVTRLDYPFVTERMNSPDGVNLMANTSILGLSVPLAPLTLLVGPHASFVALVLLAFVATALAWYYVLSRHLLASRGAALVGAGFCAFAPGMISHGNGHPNIVAQFLVPFITLWTLRLREPGRWRRNGAVLGLLITWQAFINEEVLLLTALGLGIFVLVMAALRPEHRRAWRTFLAGLAVATGVAIVLLAYPLWVQFTGPGAYHGLRSDVQSFGADLGSFPAFSRESLAGSASTARGLAPNSSEENAFLGWPLLLLLGGIVWWLRRNAAALGLASVAVLLGLSALGPRIRWHGHPIARGPWSVLQHLPLLNSVVPTRMALALVPPVGLLLALAWDRWRAAPPSGRWRYAFPVLLAAALLPIAPTPLPDRPRPPTPAPMVDGRLAALVPQGRAVLFVPPPFSRDPQPLVWAAEAHLTWAITHGYFLGPVRDPARPDLRYAIFTAPPRPTSELLYRVAASGEVPEITPALRRAALEDLRYWRVSALVLVPRANEDALRRVTTELVGVEPRQVDGVWIWDVRATVP
jgi:hypothetical protein